MLSGGEIVDAVLGPKPPQASVRVLTDDHDSAWAGTPIAVTLDLMEDGTVKWRNLQGALVTVMDQPGERNIAEMFKGAGGE